MEDTVDHMGINNINTCTNINQEVRNGRMLDMGRRIIMVDTGMDTEGGQGSIKEYWDEKGWGEL